MSAPSKPTIPASGRPAADNAARAGHGAKTRKDRLAKALRQNLARRKAADSSANPR